MNKLTPQPKTKRNHGFTLIELLTVIAIIGILAGIAIPAAGKVLDMAKKMGASANVKNIVTAYNMIQMEGKTVRGVRSTNDWAVQLAMMGGLNDGTMYYLTPPQQMNKVIVDTKNRSVKDSIKDMKGFDAPDYDAVSNLPPNITNKDTVPLIWTTGIKYKTSTTWDFDAPWSQSGGHIGFLSGIVEWFDDTADQLVDYGSKQKADKIGQAIPRGTIAVEPSGKKSAMAGMDASAPEVEDEFAEPAAQ
jgi:prepilin-type N-terminal cleavage/methylation domain-containing protein